MSNIYKIPNLANLARYDFVVEDPAMMSVVSQLLEFGQGWVGNEDLAKERLIKNILATFEQEKNRFAVDKWIEADNSRIRVNLAIEVPETSMYTRYMIYDWIRGEYDEVTGLDAAIALYASHRTKFIEMHQAHEYETIDSSTLTQETT